MAHNSIPDWNAQGLLPPISELAPTSYERSPYRVSLVDLILRLATTPKRTSILEGFLSFRSALHNVGLIRGFQWVDGSFMENIELIEERDPGDIDVVTFYHSPVGKTQQELIEQHQHLFDSGNTKEDYCVDAYYKELDGDNPEVLVWQASYWYSLWSHRRTRQWKGFLQIDLSPAEDEVAKANLGKLSGEGNQT